MPKTELQLRLHSMMNVNIIIDDNILVTQKLE